MSQEATDFSEMDMTQPPPPFLPLSVVLVSSPLLLSSRLLLPLSRCDWSREHGAIDHSGKDAPPLSRLIFGSCNPRNQRATLVGCLSCPRRGCDGERVQRFLPSSLKHLRGEQGRAKFRSSNVNYDGQRSFAPRT
eukprot:767307-Hanusia_phi.AAC.3